MSYRHAILIMVLALRLWELQYSWRNLRGEGKAGRARLIHEPRFSLMVGVHAGWFVGAWVEILWLEPHFVPWLALPMLMVWGLALALRFWVVASLGSSWNVRLVQRREQTVVTGGPYRYLRHPNYLAVILEITAVPLLIGAYWTALAATLANGWVLWERIRLEEAYLFQFRKYHLSFAAKKRLIPGIF